MPQTPNNYEAVSEERKSEKQGADAGDDVVNDDAEPERPTEIGGRDGPDPTRYGDWEKGGRCIDF